MKLIPSYDYYIFDLDLTLFDTSKPAALAYKSAFTAVGAEYDNANLFIYLSEFLTETYDRIYNPSGNYQVFEAAFYAKSHKVMTAAVAYDDVKKTLDFLKNREKKVAIVTNKDAEAVKIILKAQGFGFEYFDNIVSCDMIANKKPAPDSLLLCLKNLGVESDNFGLAVYIGDAKNDILAAKNAGIDGILISRQPPTNHENESTIVIDSLVRLTEIFKGD